MRFTATVTACAFALLLAGCEFMPGTEAHRVAQAKRAVAKLLIDPASVQFRNVAARSGYVCGELNGRNRMGAFVGFKRFVVRLNGEDPVVDPEVDYSDLISAEESCESLAGNSYASLSTRLSACQRAAEQRAAADLQASFNERWEKRCGGKAGSSVYRPPLADATASPDAAPEQPAQANDTIEVDAGDTWTQPDDRSNALEPLVDSEGNPIGDTSDANMDVEPIGD